MYVVYMSGSINHNITNLTLCSNPKEIVYVEEFDSRSKAMKREREIKPLSHNEKNQVVSSYDQAN